MIHLLDPRSCDLQQWLQEHDQPKYRAAQIRDWIFKKRIKALDEMTNLPQALREQLASDFQLWTSKIVKHQQSSDGTEKLLLEYPDGERIECVLLREGKRRSICVSSQVGCAMGCVFCASGLDGVSRNLTSGEIVEQMLRLALLLPEDERLTNLVVMGMGEPLANLNALLPALEEASSDTGLRIGSKRITISTVGLPPAIQQLAEKKCRYSLAVSLHAADDQLRQQLVKVSRNTPLAAIMKAADHYFETSGRRLTFEYVLLAGINDQTRHAHSLAKLLSGRTAMLNLIPYNPVDGLPYRTPAPSAIKKFSDILQQAGINVLVRFRKGDEIDAACGQLRRNEQPLVMLDNKSKW